MSKKRTPKTKVELPSADNDAAVEQTPDAISAEAATQAAVASPDDVTNIDDAAPESERRPKGKKSKRDKKDKTAKAAKAAEGDKQDKRDKKDKHGKKTKKDKAAKAVQALKPDQERAQERDRKDKRDKPKGKKEKLAFASKLRPLKKVNVLLIEPDGQPRAHFDGEIGVLDLLLPKTAEGDDSGV